MGSVMSKIKGKHLCKISNFIFLKRRKFKSGVVTCRSFPRSSASVGIILVMCLQSLDIVGVKRNNSKESKTEKNEKENSKTMQLMEYQRDGKKNDVLLNLEMEGALANVLGSHKILTTKNMTVEEFYVQN